MHRGRKVLEAEKNLREHSEANNSPVFSEWMGVDRCSQTRKEASGGAHVSGGMPSYSHGGSGAHFGVVDNAAEVPSLPRKRRHSSDAMMHREQQRGEWGYNSRPKERSGNGSSLLSRGDSSVLQPVSVSKGGALFYSSNGRMSRRDEQGSESSSDCDADINPSRHISSSNNPTNNYFMGYSCSDVPHRDGGYGEKRQPRWTSRDASSHINRTDALSYNRNVADYGMREEDSPIRRHDYESPTGIYAHGFPHKGSHNDGYLRSGNDEGDLEGHTSEDEERHMGHAWGKSKRRLEAGWGPGRYDDDADVYDGRALVNVPQQYSSHYYTTDSRQSRHKSAALHSYSSHTNNSLEKEVYTNRYHHHHIRDAQCSNYFADKQHLRTPTPLWARKHNNSSRYKYDPAAFAQTNVRPKNRDSDGYPAVGPGSYRESLLAHHILPRHPHRYSMLGNIRGPCEHSGFINPDNDCYACSVLTLLLRSPVFSNALLAAPIATNTDVPISTRTVSSPNADICQVFRDVENTAGFIEPVRQEANTSSLHHVLQNFARVLERPQEIISGIDMRPLHHLFGNNFFAGDQEDAHEFFLAIIDKLTEESKTMLKAIEKSKELDETDAARLKSKYGSISEGVGKEEENASEENDVDSSRIWVSNLITGKLLSIIRCGNVNCGHEIATVDPFVNLSLTLLKEEEAGDESSQQCSPQVAVTQSDVDAGAACASATTPTDILGASTATPRVVHDLKSLLKFNFRFSALESYVCDACGSSKNQLQGVCLLGSLPSLLVVQVKRFTTQFSKELGAVVSKDTSEVFVNRKIVLYALDEDHYSSTEKKLKPEVCSAERSAQQQASGETMDEVKTSVKVIRCLYMLRGTVLHLGGTLNAGHYTTEFSKEKNDVKVEKGDKDEGQHDETGNSQGQAMDSAGVKVLRTNTEATPRAWFMADDARVLPLPEDHSSREGGRSSTCYLLLYERVEEESVSCHVWNVLPQSR
uniref:ubiquitinyl hydrolase 1 n=1 Tax=Trypanosoma congolense (strain IL3000) TaxID=1068625 RepID=G0UMV7_TRYCI|nr:putative ubiquitin carboxyl-terminal hydrolase [Trypanosoma congolense IL3000]